ncbi:MAG: response regulator transcription factor [Planctomycetes bacterium]|nr:response regulator transcription factor [Planctomycetota bacterium]
MANKTTPQVFVVDDDSCIRDSLCVYLKKARFECTCFENVDDCLKHFRQHHCDLLITDVVMPGKTGLDLLDEIKRIAPWVPVLVITSYSEVPVAIKAVKAGAVDFVEKPLDMESFISLAQSTITQNDPNNFLRGKNLTKTEKIILSMVLQGKANKEIANILHRSIRTVEVHRSHIMGKLDVHSVVDLVKRVTAMDLEGY